MSIFNNIEKSLLNIKKSISIGERISFFRKQRGLSQEQLGKLLGKNRVTVTNYESNKIELTVAVLFEVVKALDITIVDLLSDKEFESQKDSDYNGLSYIEELKFKLRQMETENEFLKRELATSKESVNALKQTIERYERQMDQDSKLYRALLESLSKKP